MIAVLYQVTDPTIAISCGTYSISPQAEQSLVDKLGPNLINGLGYGGPACDAMNIAEYLMNLPATTLWEGDPLGIPAGHHQGITLDLYVSQQAALSA